MERRPGARGRPRPGIENSFIMHKESILIELTQRFQQILVVGHGVHEGDEGVVVDVVLLGSLLHIV